MSNSDWQNNNDIEAWKEEISSCLKLEKKHTNKKINDPNTEKFPHKKDNDSYKTLIKNSQLVESYENSKESIDADYYDSNQEIEEVDTSTFNKPKQRERVVFDTEKNNFYNSELYQNQNGKSTKSLFSFLKNANTLDKKADKKLKRGEYPIDATLDLHGLSLEKAHENLLNFLNSAIKMKLRCLLVITGKGLHSDKNSITIKEEFPNWVYHFGIKEHIITYIKAHEKHGGSGAFYILLRRQK